MFPVEVVVEPVEGKMGRSVIRWPGSEGKGEEAKVRSGPMMPPLGVVKRGTEMGSREEEAAAVAAAVEAAAAPEVLVRDMTLASTAMALSWASRIKVVVRAC